MIFYTCILIKYYWWLADILQAVMKRVIILYRINSLEVRRVQRRVPNPDEPNRAGHGPAWPVLGDHLQHGVHWKADRHLGQAKQGNYCSFQFWSDRLTRLVRVFFKGCWPKPSASAREQSHAVHVAHLRWGTARPDRRVPHVRHKWYVLEPGKIENTGFRTGFRIQNNTGQDRTG